MEIVVVFTFGIILRSDFPFRFQDTAGIVIEHDCNDVINFDVGNFGNSAIAIGLDGIANDFLGLVESVIIATALPVGDFFVSRQLDKVLVIGLGLHVGLNGLREIRMNEDMEKFFRSMTSLMTDVE